MLSRQLQTKLRSLVSVTRTATSQVCGSLHLFCLHPWRCYSTRVLNIAKDKEQAAQPEAYVQLPAKGPVRMVANDGSHRIVAYQDALQQAKEANTDLIFVARNARPPVVKLGEAQKALFDHRRKEKDLKRRQLEARRAQALKEVRLGAKIAEHDLSRLLKGAREFVEKGYRVRLSIPYNRKGAKDAFTKLTEVRNKCEEWAATAAPGANDRVMASTCTLILSKRTEA